MRSTPGLAQIGLMQRDQALWYLSNECIPANPDPVALEAEWMAATAKVTGPPANFGQPDIADVPAQYQTYIDQLRNSPDWAPTFATNPTWEIKIVEAAPLLAFQFSVHDGAATNHGGTFSSPPTMDELLNSCLPLNQIQQPFTMTNQGHAIMVQAPNLNVRPLFFGPDGPGVFSLRFGVGLPFTQVVRFNGRCFLFNGYHRTYATLVAGGTHIPCIFRDVQHPNELGIAPPGTFDLAQLEPGHPPTLHHFASGQAHAVDLVVKARTIHISCTDWVTPAP